MNGQSADQTRRIKKRRRRKASKSQTAQDSSEYTEDESDSGDEETSTHLDSKETLTTNHPETEEAVTKVEEKETESNVEPPQPVRKEEPDQDSKSAVPVEENSPPSEAEVKTEHPPLKEERSSLETHQTTPEAAEDPAAEEDPSTDTKPTTSNLKPDAEEFVPRAYRSSPLNTVPFIKVPPNFVPIPVLPLGEFNGQNFNPAFIPPGIPINFLPPDPKMFPNFVGFVPNGGFAPKNETDEHQPAKAARKKDNCDSFNTAKVESSHQSKEPVEKVLVQNINSKAIDIATIVSKLEEAAKEQENEDSTQTEDSPRRKFPENKYNRSGPKYKNYKRSYYNSPHTSPQKRNYYMNGIQLKDARDDKPYNRQTNYETEANDDASNETNVPPSEAEVRENVQETPKQPRNSPEKTKKIWKPHYQNGNVKWHQNNTKDFRYKQNGKVYGENDVRDHRPKQGYKNYSDTVANRTQTYATEPKSFLKERSIESPQKDAPKKETTLENLKPTASPTNKSNQWISVSNRKKRKNKSVEETDTNIEIQFEEDTEEHSNTELFESYDVNLLVDVVPTSVQSEEKVELKEEVHEMKTIEDNVPITNNDSKQTLASELVVVSDDAVRDEKDAVSKVETEKVEQTEMQLAIEDSSIVEDAAIIEDIADLAALNISSVEVREEKKEAEPNEKAKKKSKKGTQKPLTKRVIITDLDLSMKNEEIKTPVKKVVTKLNDAKPVNEKPEEKPEVIDKDPVAVEKTMDGNEEDKKRSKKKKKKTAKLTTTSSLSSSNTTINVDDSYDFLLETNLSEESVEKTNVEVSQELDKLIQRGMYSCLEEKIRSLNIDESDGFFKSIFSTITSRESSVEKAGYAQTPDLAKMLQNTRKVCPSSSVSEEHNSPSKDINTVLPDLDSPGEDGLVLDDSDTKDQIPTDEPTEVMPDAETQSYPITHAVKEWMSKSRERTPDVVLLKSPSAIYKEFCESASEPDNDTNSQTSSSCDLVTAIGEDDVTIASNDVRTDFDLSDHADSCEKPIVLNENVLMESNKYIEEGEDVVEVYDSKYGRNEDYLRIQEEAKKAANASNQKHRNMPYRAICCSIV